MLIKRLFFLLFPLLILSTDGFSQVLRGLNEQYRENTIYVRNERTGQFDLVWDADVLDGAINEAVEDAGIEFAYDTLAYYIQWSDTLGEVATITDLLWELVGDSILRPASKDISSWVDIKADSVVFPGRVSSGDIRLGDILDGASPSDTMILVRRSSDGKVVGLSVNDLSVSTSTDTDMHTFTSTSGQTTFDCSPFFSLTDNYKVYINGALNTHNHSRSGDSVVFDFGLKENDEVTITL